MFEKEGKSAARTTSRVNTLERHGVQENILDVVQHIGNGLRDKINASHRLRKKYIRRSVKEDLLKHRKNKT